MSKKRAREATENPQRQIELSHGNLLGKLFWTIIDRANITYPQWDRYMTKFVNNPQNVPEQTPDRRSERRSNLMAALTKYDRLSWNRFIEGLKSAGFSEIELTIKVRRKRGIEPVEVTLISDLMDIDTRHDHSNTKDDDHE
jgi:hypothetical protein